MSFWNRFKMSFARFMAGRYGADLLGMVSLWAAVILSLLSSLTGWGIFSLISMVLWIMTLYRMLSRNKVRRSIENDKFMRLWQPVMTWVRQLKTRLRNRKQFKYFRCPKCHALLKLPRGVGNVTMTCGKCGNSFDQKA